MAKRGRWDRAATAGDRAAAHRHGIARASARAVFELGRHITVTDILSRAEVGRNTFYVYFRDVEDVLRAAEGEALSLVLISLSRVHGERTPVERLRRMADEWLSLAREEPHLLMLLLRGDGTPRGAHSKVHEIVAGTLGRIAAGALAAGVVGRRMEPPRLRSLVGVFVASAEAAIEQEATDEARAKDELVGASLRLLR